MAFQTFENDENNRGQIKRKNLKNEIRSAWLGIRDGNITFQDSLDFDLSEIDSVYDNNEGLAKTMRTY